MIRIAFTFIIAFYFSACGSSRSEDEASNALKLAALIGEWKSDCFDGDDGNGNNQSVQFTFYVEPRSGADNVQARGKMDGYNGHGCLGTPAITKDANDNLITGQPPITDILSYKTQISGLPSKYLMLSGQGLDSNGDPDGAAMDQVLELRNDRFYILSIGSNVTGNTWDEWKSSSAVVTQFENDPDAATQNYSEDSFGTNVLKLNKQ